MNQPSQNFFDVTRKELKRRYIDYDEFKDMDDEEFVIVNRITILTKLAMYYAKQQDDKELYDKLIDINFELRKKDMELKRPVWGIELTVGEVKSIFTENDLKRSRTSLMRSPHTKSDTISLN